MTDFFQQDYKLPTTSNYMKFLEGENTFRVLSSAIVGYEYFNKENKPIRSKLPFDETPNIKEGSEVKHFWAFAVWNYKDERVQILELTQKSIMQYIKGLVDNKRWGNPTGYDITVSRTGTGLATEYTCRAEPHSTLEDKIAEAWSKANVNLNALYKSEDPFKKKDLAEATEEELEAIF
jgi:hypothetical protein